jgi:hypothetical protein
VEDLDGQVLPLFPQKVLALLLQYYAGPVVGVDDVVALLEVADKLDVFLETGLCRFS